MSNKVFCPSCGVDFLATTAARTGGICMRCLQEGPPQPSKVVKKARKKPARCVAVFALESFVPGNRENRETLHSAFFNIACPCGGKTFLLSGFHEPPGSSAASFFPPLTLTCKKCQMAMSLFDPKVDGYDAENGALALHLSHESKATHACAKCSEKNCEISVSLEYTFGDEELEDCKEMKHRPQDFFTSINIYATCENCRERDHVVSYESA